MTQFWLGFLTGIFVCVVVFPVLQLIRTLLFWKLNNRKYRREI